MKNLSADHFIFLPGYGNSLGEHWQAKWYKDFPNATWVEQSDWDYPTKTEWVEQLHKVIVDLEKPLVIIAHSLGCLTFVEWVVKYHSQKPELIKKIRAAFLVAVPDSDADTFPKAISGFGGMKMSSLGIKTLMVASLNDPYATPDRVEAFAKAWDADLTWVGEAGHINVSAGFGPWPQGKEHLQHFLS